MAVAPTKPSERRVVFALNSALQVVLALAAVVLLVGAAAQFGRRLDLSSSRSNSLSPRTLALLSGLPTDVRVTGLYSTALKDYRKHDQKRRDRVADLLTLYESRGRGRISAAMLDPQKERTRLAELIARLRQKPSYREELKPLEALLEQFAPVKARIVELIQRERDTLERLGQADPRLASVPQTTTIRLATQELLKDATQTEQDLTKTREVGEGEIPRFMQAVAEIAQHLGAVQKSLQGIQTWMMTEGSALPGLTDETVQHFRGSQARFEPLLNELTELIPKFQGSTPPRLETIADTLVQGQTILVETDESAEVLTLDDVWPYRSERSAPAAEDGDPRDFAGEQAVSSAILKLTQKDKTAVIFVRVGGQPLLHPDFSRFQQTMQMPGPAPYGQLNDLLGRQNFLTQEWDVAASPTPPTVAGAARRVYVLLAPEPSRNPMQPFPQGITPEQRASIEQAVEEAGTCMFLAPWYPSVFSGGYPFRDYLRSAWQVESQSDYLVLQYAPGRQKRDLWELANPDPFILSSDVLEFSGHPIVKPLASTPGAFYRAQPLRVLPVPAPPDDGHELAESAPRSPATVETLASVRPTENVWATSDVERLQEDFRQRMGTQPRSEDLRPPFPVALAVTRGDGKKAVVIASERMFSDDVAQAQALAFAGGTAVLYPVYPANSDLFINAVHWLAGDVDRISVGAKRGDVPRLDRLKEGWAANLTRAFVMGIWPAVVLLIGGGVWMMRRR
jgi:hypothetical protein